MYCLCEDIRDKLTAAQLTTIMTVYNHMETFVSRLEPALLKAFVKDNRESRDESWEETKKVGTAEVKHKLGEDPIFAKSNRLLEARRLPALAAMAMAWPWKTSIDWPSGTASKQLNISKRRLNYRGSWMKPLIERRHYWTHRRSL